MISIFEQTQSQVKAVIVNAFEKAMADGTLPQGTPADFIVEVPGDTTKGDFASNAAMVNARALRLAPIKIAQILSENFDFTDSYIDHTQVAGPGFINFFMKPTWFCALLAEIGSKGVDFGRSDFGKGQKVMVEYVSANPTGPMHMGNARGGAIGDVLAETFAWSGHDTTREFYINDAGNQINKFGISLATRYLQIYKGEEAVPFPEDAYLGDDIKVHAQAFADEHGDKYLDHDKQALQQILIDYALPKNIASLEYDLGRYRIVYDVWFRESVLHPDGVTKAIEKLRANDMAYEKDGVIWYKSSAYGAEKDDVLVRANGIPTYFAADIAYHYNKFVDRGFDKVINVWGADHHGHVARLKGSMDALGLDGSKLDIVLMQLVRLMKDGEPYRMSKRSGKSITLTSLLDEVPLDAARFFFIMREPGSPLDFDLDLAVEESSTNPVFYVQYAYARICSIIKNITADGFAMKELTLEELEILSTNEEKELIRRLGQLPQEIIAAAVGYDPAKISSYISDVATLFHKFYNNCKVNCPEVELKHARLTLCHATATVLKNSLEILKITAPEVM